MLQQTQVARVAERFERFMRRFPSPKALARASDQTVLAEWQGLGYYRRARLLRAAAAAVVESHRGVLPKRSADLERLPGVGRYTAGAVASIVHGERVPIVDGNVSRVLLRIGGKALPLRDPRAQRWCWAAAKALVSRSRSPGLLNEGLMELGATVCTPTRPRCGDCPVRRSCAACADEAQGRIPAPPAVRIRPIVRMHAVVAANAKGVVLEERPARGMWAGLWQPPSIERRSAQGRRAETRWTARLVEIAEISHRTTHRDFRVRVFRGRPSEVMVLRPGARLVPWTRVRSVPLSSLARRVLASDPTIRATPAASRALALDQAARRRAHATARRDPGS